MPQFEDRVALPFSRPSPREWLVACAVALFTVGLTSLPYVLGYLTAREGWAFVGLLMNPEDSQTYFAKMLQGYDGAWRYTIPFTHEAHDGVFVGVFYVWLGHLARWLGLSLAAIWHLSRGVADLILFLTTFGFVAAFLPNRRARWTAYLLSIYGSGLGWVLFLLNQPYWLGAFPVDFKQPEAHLLFMALTFPHVALGTALTLLNVWLLPRLTLQPLATAVPWRTVFAAGAINVALGIAYPFLIYLVALLFALHWVYLSWEAGRLLWRQALVYAAAFALAAPLYLYYAVTLQRNPIFRAWEAQAGTPALPWPHYVLAFGAMLLLALMHWVSRPQHRSRFASLWLWAIAAALLLYAPMRQQRRFIQGVHVPLAIMATAGFLDLVLPRLERSAAWRRLVALPRYSSNRLARLMIALFLAFMSLSNMYVLASVSVSAVVQQIDTLFRPVDEIEAARWLRSNVDRSAVIFADYLTGNYVAAHAGHRVVLGHWAETYNYREKDAAVSRFFSADATNTWRRDLLRRYQVDYVWHGPRERELGTFEPADADYLRPIFQRGAITLYEVQ